MTKRSHAMRTSRFTGHAAMGRVSPARGSMNDLRLVDVRLNAIEMGPAPAIPPAILAVVEDSRRARAVNGHPVLLLDELPNAADAPGWHDEDGRFHPPMGEAGVEALRDLLQDRRIRHDHQPAL